ncbi:MAG: hypothetical protein ACUVR7_00125 [Armatimonadota bacterium]
MKHGNRTQRDDINQRFGGQQPDLPVVCWSAFDINSAPPACKIAMPDGSIMALSRWSTPKRTRTYPFARVYDTYSHNGKIVTVIPTIKDEGRGQRRCDTNNDRINFITLSWMNLMNVYVVLAYYVDADKVNDYRITNQRLPNVYIKGKLGEIAEYKLDGHHWNRKHFREDFVSVFECAVNAYERIAKEKQVHMHPLERHRSFLDRIRDSNNSQLLDPDRFREHTLRRSRLAALRETTTQHARERLSANTTKALLELRNNLGGDYTLTADEVFLTENGTLVIQESKNATGALPSEDDIKDGLFKLLLYSSIDTLYLGDEQVPFITRLRLTGNFKGSLQLPTGPDRLSKFCEQNEMHQSHCNRLHWLNEELRQVGISGVLEGH